MIHSPDIRIMKGSHLKILELPNLQNVGPCIAMPCWAVRDRSRHVSDHRAPQTSTHKAADEQTDKNENKDLHQDNLALLPGCLGVSLSVAPLAVLKAVESKFPAEAIVQARSHLQIADLTRV
jgi:hypothetical protein